MKMMKKIVFAGIVLSTLLFLCLAGFMESSAWARAGSGGSMGSRGSRSFSTPSMPSSPSSPRTPYSSPSPGIPQTPGQPSSGMFGRSPFMQGMAGGLAGGFLGSLLFGSRGYAQPMGSTGGGGFGLLDLIIVGALIYFGFKFYRRWRAPRASTGYYEEGGPSRFEGPPGTDHLGSQPYPGSGGPDYSPPYDEVDRGFQQIRRSDPSFSEAKFLETVQDIFFRIQASWMHRSIATMGSMLTPEMAQFFVGEIDGLKQAGRINKLENIAVRKVEPSEVWQEDGKDYVTVLFTANLLDYTVDEKTGQVIEGDEINPVKFQEFWTFCRDTGSEQWQLSAINQPK